MIEGVAVITTAQATMTIGIILLGAMLAVRGYIAMTREVPFGKREIVAVGLAAFLMIAGLIVTGGQL
ncbi:MAG: hypothetical protein SF123_07680 [Chloroflexota bacterium]|nr:hypothetical protein [Chloroflexota bacterium]